MHPLYEHLMNWNYCYIDLASYYCLCLHLMKAVSINIRIFSFEFIVFQLTSIFVCSVLYGIKFWILLMPPQIGFDFTESIIPSKLLMTWSAKTTMLLISIGLLSCHPNFTCLICALGNTYWKPFCCHIKGGNCSTCSQNFQCIFNKREICPVFNLSTVMCSFGVDSFSMYFQLN